MRKNINGNNNPNFGNNWTKTQKKKQSILTKKAMSKIDLKEIILKNRRSYKDKENPFYGKKHKELSREKMGKSRLGKNNPNYIHGKGYKIYPKEYFIIRTKIYKRDNYICQLCNTHPINCECHHIDYNKQNNREKNLITLCRQCNQRVNSNRNYWYAYFTYLIERKYNAKRRYTPNQI